MRYFPDLVSGWLFLVALAGVLATASYTDERSTTVPKWLTIPALAVGLVLSGLRGGWLAAHGMDVWLFTAPGVLAGVVDGLLFALAGFAVGFALFFGMWLLGVCGGGDVKLVAALGAWLGAWLIFCTLLVSLVLLCICVFVVIVLRLLRGKRVAAPGDSEGRPRRPVIIRFSLVASLAVLLVTLWAFRLDLGLAQPRPIPASAEVSHHAR
jgi:Flp pilus assembly protein protease CpaA